MALWIGGGLFAVGLVRLAGIGLLPPLLFGAANFSADYLMMTGHLRDASRLRLVFLLVFGLIHGFGFAAGLLSSPIPAARLAALPVGSNLGVEVGLPTPVMSLWGWPIYWGAGTLRCHGRSWSMLPPPRWSRSAPDGPSAAALLEGVSMPRRSTALLLLAAIAAAVALPALAAVKEDVAAIRAARAASNAGIAAHDAATATAALDPAARVQASSGGLIENKAAMMRAFESSFADPKFIKFVRTSEKIEVGDDAAAETGRWVGEWKAKTVSGRYLVRWNRIGGQWRIVGELYIPLACKGPDCGA